MDSTCMRYSIDEQINHEIKKEDQFIRGDGVQRETEKELHVIILLFKIVEVKSKIKTICTHPFLHN